MSEQWSNQAWLRIADVYEQTKHNPFIIQLMDGSLPWHKFEYYLNQDKIYLGRCAGFISRLIALLEKPEHKRLFEFFLETALGSEKELNAFFIGECDPDVEASTVCSRYISHLEDNLQGGVQLALASQLPCYWVYNEMGKYIYSHSNLQGNPYRKWIETYGSDQFTEDVALYISICDEMAAQASPLIRQQMLEVFRESAILDSSFWQDAYING